jgi:hypothetical protein
MGSDAMEDQQPTPGILLPGKAAYIGKLLDWRPFQCTEFDHLEEWRGYS